MRIVFLIYSMSAGGAERVTAHLANSWSERGDEVAVMTFAPKNLDFYSLLSGVKRLELNIDGVSEHLLVGLIANLRRVRAINRALRDLRADVVVGMMATASVLALLATLRLDCRVIVSERTYPPMFPIGRVWGVLRRMAYPMAYRVVMQTSEGLRWLESKIPKARGVVIPNPVTYPLPSGEPVLLPVRFIVPERKLLLAVGRLDEGKQFDRLLESFAALAACHPLWDLVILGDGPERSRLEQQIITLGLGQRALLPGKAGNIGDWYGRADLYVMSSRFEGFPNTLAEAMAYGCAAVSYDCDTGPRDIIRHEQDGLLVAPVGDVVALTRALNRLMSDDAEREQMATRAIEVRERYSLQSILAMWDKEF